MKTPLEWIVELGLEDYRSLIDRDDITAIQRDAEANSDREIARLKEQILDLKEELREQKLVEYNGGDL